MNGEKSQWEGIYQQDGRAPFEPRPVITQFIQSLSERGLCSVLDLGCGSGRHVIHMIQNGLRVTGLDNAPTALKLSAEWLVEEGLAGGLVLSDMRQPLPFMDGSFDAVLSTQVIHHARLETVIGTAREIDRITRRGGMILISVPSLEAVREDSQEFTEIEPNTFLPLDGPEKGLPHHVFSAAELECLFPGFLVLDLREVGGRVIVLRAEKIGRPR
jgi:SAM-dependent methyltransferase